MSYLRSLPVYFLEISGTAFIAPSARPWVLLNQCQARPCITSITAICILETFSLILYMSTSLFERSLQDRSPVGGDTDADVDGKIITSPRPTNIASGEYKRPPKHELRHLVIVLVPRGSYEIFNVHSRLTD
ncbi:hypothetical protein COCC4DRAFT_125521 [Bipolaris maydis ATCC 48331]|uniref:Uncharacterized protein n=2 Tax=Cochliobolus heterostrophus TaxID=5016 RepID=M2U7X5_COCH5|nr:uncharacterized protein COCC4DRAFT_125521 [Bipolaris maydis ATCC 48331]EMD89836.1 hypothetical protein COCHEDRAFT_1031221 [Bipolaris maydis C5]ENI09951.1 hypothetical protein COCC4DRAFT_125521 [Bipolaris maydis ATCC 48331]KAJ6207674.1 hypothetical protein PSV09DRAFT_1031221 [Bipolaris maydis]